MQHNQSKKCYFSWCIDILCTMFSDLSMRGLMSLSVSVKNMFTLLLPSPLIPWYGELRKGTNLPGERERPGTVQCKRQSTKDRTGMQNSAEGTNVIVCSVRDEILFMYLQLSALCCSYLSFALFMHFRTSDLRNSWYHFYFLPIKKEKSECFIFQICSTFDLLCSNLGCF